MSSVKMPQLGETVIEGTILKWLKQEGDDVAIDEPLFEISTDKVDTEVPASEAGVLTKILVPEGSTVAVGTEVAEISGSDGKSNSTSAETPPTEIRPQPLVTGDDLIALGYQPGPRFKEILRAIEEAQLEGEIRDRNAALALLQHRFPP